MTHDELRKESGYIEAKEKIINYPAGFHFTVPLYKMPKAKRNAMEILLQDCCNENLIDSLSIDLDLQGNITEETYERK